VPRLQPSHQQLAIPPSPNQANQYRRKQNLKGNETVESDNEPDNDSYIYLSAISRQSDERRNERTKEGEKEAPQQQQQDQRYHRRRDDGRVLVFVRTEEQ
jgi:hypothetical protein